MDAKRKTCCISCTDDILPITTINFLIQLVKNVHDERGGVVAAIATMGVIVGTVTINEKGLNGTPMFLGAMVMGPIAAHLMKKI